MTVSPPKAAVARARAPLGRWFQLQRPLAVSQSRSPTQLERSRKTAQAGHRRSSCSLLVTCSLLTYLLNKSLSSWMCSEMRSRHPVTSWKADADIPEQRTIGQPGVCRIDPEAMGGQGGSHSRSQRRLTRGLLGFFSSCVVYTASIVRSSTYQGGRLYGTDAVVRGP